MYFADPEQLVDQEAKQVKIPIELEAAQRLLDSGRYEPAGGLKSDARHFRAPRGATGNYHLEVTGNKATLHWEGWDPRRYPVEHVQETPALRKAAVIGGSIAGAGLLFGVISLVRKLGRD